MKRKSKINPVYRDDESPAESLSKIWMFENYLGAEFSSCAQ
jgi:hypothetical protein